MKKKILSLILAAALTLSLAACGRGGDESGDQTDNSDGGAGNSAASVLPEFVYVPEFLQMEEENISFYNSKVLGDYFYYISYNYDEETETSGQCLNRYSFQEGTTDQIPLQLPTNANMNSWALGPEDSVYAALYIWNFDEETGESDTTRMLAKYDAQGNEIYANTIDDLLTDENSYFSSLAVDGQGRVYLMGDTILWLFDEEGNSQGTVTVLSGGNGWVQSLGRGRDGKVYVSVYDYTDSENPVKLTEVDYDAKKMGTSYKGFTSSGGSGALCAGDEYDFMTYDSRGVYGYSLETETSERLLYWLDSDINGSYVNSLGVMEDGRLVAIYQDWQSNDNGVALLTKTRSAELPQKETVVVAAMSPSMSLQSAVVNFNRNSDTYRITVKQYLDYDNWYENAYQDALTNLNNDITSSGNCPDVIELDSVNASQLAAKGVFEDLSPYLEQSSALNRSDFMESVLEAYTYDGVLISIPNSIALQTLIGSPDMVGRERGWTLADMIDFAEAHPEAELFDGISRESILNFCLIYNMDSFVDWSKAACHFDSQEFKDLLNFAGRFSSRENMEWDPDAPSEPTRIQNGEVLLSYGSIYDFDEIQIYKEMFGGEITCIGYPNSEGTDGVAMRGTDAYAITTRSGAKEGAWAFIESLLTREEGQFRFSSGFPTNRTKLNAMIEEAIEVKYITDENGEFILDENGDPIAEGGTSSIGYQDGWSYTFRKPTQEEVDLVLELMESAKPVSSSNDQIFTIISEEAAPFFEGQKSVEEVVGIIQSRVGIYVDENS